MYQSLFCYQYRHLYLSCSRIFEGKCCPCSIYWLVGYFVYYPRPVLAFGYCCCLRLCVSVCLSVCQSLACPHNNSGPVQARITKFGPKMQKILIMVPIVLWTDWPWLSRSNLIRKSKFTPFWACLHHNSPPIQAGITKFVQEVQNTLVKIPIVLEGNWPWPQRSNMT